ncbi:dynein regulatory complex protein 8-like [Ischnura elegans]|uniref:dynein regulatory complex protein 8-like n=1 Tax=Ischnura elegans TaxID=197161 RepID=UPI001ED8BCE6|nr:dynein regulatory complex protein 8-like [Ischnura elegans]
MAALTSEEADQASSDLEKRIVEAFDVFDHGGSKTVDVREVGTILRALGCCPTEADIQEIIIQVEDQETSGSVRLDRFLPFVSQLIQENKYPPASPEKLLKAFQTLDSEGQGFLTKECLSRMLTDDVGGVEPFTKEELDEMLAVAVNNESGTIVYEDFINLLMVRLINTTAKFTI